MKNIFAEKLKELRLEAGLTQKQLADKLGNNIDQSSIARWEQGTRMPLFDAVIIIANYFGVSIDYLAGRED